MKLEKWAKNGQMGQNSQPLSPPLQASSLERRVEMNYRFEIVKPNCKVSLVTSHEFLSISHSLLSARVRVA